MTTSTDSLTDQLENARIALGDDYRFVMRCQDGEYGQLIAEVAVDVVARETVDGDEPTDTGMADSIIAEVSQTERDVRPLAA